MSPRVAIAFAGALILWGCGGPAKPKPTPQKGAEICANGIDDNGDGKVDCADPFCFRDKSCASSGEDCGNGIDDNADGLTDCDDAQCVGLPGCTAAGGGTGTGGGGGTGTGGGGGGAGTGG